MDTVDRAWLREFDAAMVKFFAIDHQMAGMDDEVLSRYADLLPREAALMFGDDYDLSRVDIGWR
ncbi:MAG TPA: hypothetical protein VIR56_02895 [Solimonas sp.]